MDANPDNPADRNRRARSTAAFGLASGAEANSLRKMPPPPDLPESVARGQWRIFERTAARLGPPAAAGRSFPARLKQALAEQRGLGARDRRLQRELLFALCRCEPWATRLRSLHPSAPLQLAAALAEVPLQLAAASGLDPMAVLALRQANWQARPALLRALFPGHDFDPADLTPAWFAAACPCSAEVCSPEAVWSRPPVWLRLQGSDALRTTALAELAHAGAEPTRSDLLPQAVRIDSRLDLSRTSAFARGLFEAQDLGSQLILAVAAPQPGELWLDACAGAGGKTLQLAELLGDRGSVLAEDRRAEALGELSHRAQRSGRRNLRLRAVPADPAGWRPEGSFDGVLLDVPCTGTGTWRRHPHLRICTRQEELAAATALQARLLDSRSQAVRPGGKLIYATCSLLPAENEQVVLGFLASHPEFADSTPATAFGFERGRAGLTILPSRHDTDGFFVAVLRHRGTV